MKQPNLQEPTTMNMAERIKWALPFFCLMIFLGCGSPQEKAITGKHIELNFSGINNIKEGYWIEIDGYRFNHYATTETYESGDFSLPASDFYHEEERQDTGELTKLHEPFTGMDIALRMNIYFNLINETNPLLRGDGFQLRNTSPQLLMLTGRLRVMRADSTEFTIRAHPDYPVPFSLVD